MSSPPDQLEEAGCSPRTALTRSPPPRLANKLRRMAWNIAQATIYRWSPVPLHGWRRFLLRTFGATVETGAHPYPDAKVWAPWNLTMKRGSCLGPRSNCYSAGKVYLGEDAIVSQGAHLCGATHDYRNDDFTLLTGSITIEKKAWVAAEAFVGPGVIIHEGAVVGARAVAVKNVAANTVVAGNPAVCVSRPRIE